MATVSNQHPFSAPSEALAPSGAEFRGGRDSLPGDSVWPVLLRLADVSQVAPTLEPPPTAVSRIAPTTSLNSEPIPSREPSLRTGDRSAEPPLIHISQWSLSAGLADDPPSQTPLAAEEPAPDQPDGHLGRKDKHSHTGVHLRPRRRALSWIPTVPPSLLLGILICAGALLLGILFRGEKRSETQAVSPPGAEQADSPKQPEHVAEVPDVNDLSSAEDAAGADVTAAQSPSTAAAANPPGRTADKSAKKTASNKKKVAAKQQPQPVATAQPQVVAGQPGVNQLQTEVAGMPTSPAGQQPDTHYHQAPVREAEFQARRPVAEFRGIITKPDGASSYERY